MAHRSTPLGQYKATGASETSRAYSRRSGIMATPTQSAGSGVKFRRQHGIDKFIVDFYCHEARLIIEVDGFIHEYSVEEDAIRQEYLEGLGFRVIRFTNDDVLNTLENVIGRIRTALILH